jgi:hypothetical protein
VSGANPNAKPMASSMLGFAAHPNLCELSKQHGFLTIRGCTITLLTLSLVSQLFYTFVFANYLIGCGIKTMLLYWATFLFVPVSLSIWGIVRTINPSKFKTKLTMTIILIVIGLSGLYAFQMKSYYPSPPRYWWCGDFLESIEGIMCEVGIQ